MPGDTGKPDAHTLTPGARLNDYFSHIEQRQGQVFGEWTLDKSVKNGAFVDVVRATKIPPERVPEIMWALESRGIECRATEFGIQIQSKDTAKALEQLGLRVKDVRPFPGVDASPEHAGQRSAENSVQWEPPPLPAHTQPTFKEFYRHLNSIIADQRSAIKAHSRVVSSMPDRFGKALNAAREDEVVWLQDEERHLDTLIKLRDTQFTSPEEAIAALDKFDPNRNHDLPNGIVGWLKGKAQALTAPRPVNVDGQGVAMREHVAASAPPEAHGSGLHPLTPGARLDDYFSHIEQRQGQVFGEWTLDKSVKNGAFVDVVRATNIPPERVPEIMWALESRGIECRSTEFGIQIQSKDTAKALEQLGLRVKDVRSFPGVDAQELVVMREQVPAATSTESHGSGVQPEEMPHASNATSKGARSASIAEGGLRGAAGAAAVAMAVPGAVRAFKEGDTVGGVVQTTIAGSGAVDVTTHVAKAMGNTSSALDGASKVAGKFGAAALVAQTGYEMYQEQGTGADDKYQYKAARGVAGAVTAGAAIGTGVALGGATIAAVGVAGATAAVAAPLVAAVAVGYAANESIETAKIYSREDKRFQASQDLRHFNSMQFRLHDKLAAMGAKFDENGMLDLTDDKNREMLKTAMNEKKGELRETMANNDSIMPRWARWGKSVGEYSNAKSDLQIFEAANTELAQFETGLAANREKVAVTIRKTDQLATQPEHKRGTEMINGGTPAEIAQVPTGGMGRSQRDEPHLG